MSKSNTRSKDKLEFHRDDDDDEIILNCLMRYGKVQYGIGRGVRKSIGRMQPKNRIDLNLAFSSSIRMISIYEL